jgi:hypothetical protein
LAELTFGAITRSFGDAQTILWGLIQCILFSSTETARSTSNLLDL